MKYTAKNIIKGKCDNKNFVTPDIIGYYQATSNFSGKTLAIELSEGYMPDFNNRNSSNFAVICIGVSVWLYTHGTDYKTTENTEKSRSFSDKREYRDKVIREAREYINQIKKDFKQFYGK